MYLPIENGQRLSLLNEWGGGVAPGSEKLFLLVAAFGDQISACFQSRCRFLLLVCLTARIVLLGFSLSSGHRDVETDGRRKLSLVEPPLSWKKHCVGLKPGPPASAPECLV